MIWLTPREASVIQLVAQGVSNKSIARRLGVSLYVVKYDLRLLAKRTGARNRAHLVAQTIRLRMVSKDVATAEGEEENMSNTLLPVGRLVVVSPRTTVRGPSYRAQIVGYNQQRTKYHLGAEIDHGVYARGGSWAFPDEVEPR